MGKNYWMFADAQENFEVTRGLGFTLYGVRPRFRRRAERMQPEDRVLFYVTHLRKWVAAATITSKSYVDRNTRWNPNRRPEEYPYRVNLAPDVVLSEDDYIDALILAPRLEYVKRWAPEDWPLAFYDTLHLLPQRDFRLIEGEMRRAVSSHRNSVRRRRRARTRESPVPAPAHGGCGGQ